QLVPLHPGASDEPHIHSPPLHDAEPAGSLPQQWLVSLPKQRGAVPVHDHAPFRHSSAAYLVPQHPSQTTGGFPTHAEASLEASSPESVTPASQIAQASPSGWHAHVPSRQASAAYLRPQHPSQTSGGSPVHVAES